MTATPSTSFDEEKNIISWVVQNPNSYWSLSERMGTHLFKTEPWTKLWPILHRGWEQHNTFPSQSELATMVAKLGLEPLQRMAYIQALRNAYTADVSAYTGADITQWVALKELTILGNKLLSADFSKFDLDAQVEFYQQRLDKIKTLSGGKSIGTVSYPLRNLTNWSETIEEEFGADPITTGFYRLDRKTRDHGVRPITVLLVGPSGVGKSTILRHTIMANVRRGGRWVEFVLDDSPGEFMQRLVQYVGQRYITPDYYSDPTLKENFGKVLNKERKKSYPGEIVQVTVHPDKYGPQDFMRALQDLQRQFTVEDEAMLRRGKELPWGEAGKITGCSIDTGNQIAISKAHTQNTWYGMEKMVSTISAVPRIIKAPLFLTIQSDQTGVGASQITIRNIGVSYGMAKPAKLILGIAQTIQQSHKGQTINWGDKCWRDNESNLWNTSPQNDRDTVWEPVSLCVIKNTAGSGAKDVGHTKNVIIPLLINYATSRVIEDYASSDELMATDKKTARETREAYGGDGPPADGKPPTGEGKKGAAK